MQDKKIGFAILNARLRRAFNNPSCIGIQLRGSGIDEESRQDFLYYHEDMFRYGDGLYFERWS